MQSRSILAGLLLQLLLPGLGVSAWAEGLPGGGFEDKKKPGHGVVMELKDFRLVGEGKGVTRFIAPKPYGTAIALPAGTSLATSLKVSAPPAVKKLDPAGWYAVISVDVIGLEKPGRSEIELQASRHGAGRVLGAASARVVVVAPRGSRTTAAPTIQRLWVKLPSKVYADLIDVDLDISVSVDGSTAVVIDSLRIDRFHDQPERTLVGKPNGKNGPDLLASGALGFLALTEHQKTAFSFLEIREKGPAARAGLRRSDLVVAVAGVPLPVSSLAPGEAWFLRSHEAMLGRAIEHALEGRRPEVELTILTDKGPETLTLKPDLKAGFADTFPFKDRLVDRLRDDMLTWIAKSQQENGAWKGSPAVNPFLAGLALLGTRDRRHRQALRKLVDWMLKKNPTAADTKGFSFWSIAYQGIFLSEYYLATGDKRALTWIKEAVEWLPSTTHESKWGMQAFGHSPKGLPYDNKALMAPCAHLLVFDALAERCGVKSGIWEHTEPYVMHSWSDPEKGGHGAMGYNASSKDKAQFWSRTGLTALALKLRGHHKRMQEALVAIMVERHAYMLNSHAYGEPGAALGLLGLAVVDPDGFAKVMPQWRWRFLNAWQPGFGLRYSSPHMGSPYMGEEEIVNSAYALLFSVLDRGLVISGGQAERWLAKSRSR